MHAFSTKSTFLSTLFLNFVCCSCFLRFLLSQIKCATITLYLSKCLTPQAPPEPKVLDSQKAPETDLFLRIFLFFPFPFFIHFPIGDVQTGLELLLCKIMLQSQCGTNFSLKSQIAGSTSETCGQEGRDKEALENKYASCDHNFGLRSKVDHKFDFRQLKSTSSTIVYRSCLWFDNLILV